MGWQDVIGSVLTAGATGDPMAFSRNKLEQAFKQFQMQKMTEDLEMRKEMHEVEKRKADFSIKHLQTLMEREEEIDNSPIGGILKVFGITPPEGSEGMTVGQIKPFMGLLPSLTKKPHHEQVKGSKKISFFDPADPTKIVETDVEAETKPDKESWIDWGHGQKRNTITGEIAKVPTAPRESSTGVFDKNISIAAQAAGVDPQKVKSGKLSIEEANKVADKYKEKFGTASLLQALLGGTLGGQQPTIKYDAKGNQIK
jgi:hypothetical protein